jgi:hypothetical protein
MEIIAGLIIFGVWGFDFGVLGKKPLNGEA